MGLIVGYARTSTQDQVAGLENQIKQLSDAGCEKIFQEHISAVAARRPEFDRMMEFLREGDTLVVSTPSRLARNAVTGLSIIQDLNAKKVSVRILDMGLDTSSPSGEAMLGMMFVMAKWERDIMFERSRVGIEKAKAEGKYRGRAPTAMRKADQVLELLKSHGPAEVARQAKISVRSVYRIKEQSQCVS